ncbi:MAG TPA: enolase C-terminal domain-like protein [Chthoniobacterales bacterium]
MNARDSVPIRSVKSAAFTVPTEEAESDGTLEWSETTLVLAEVDAGEAVGIGYTYASAAAAGLITEKLATAIVGGDAMDIPAAFENMRRAIRNLGTCGLCTMAISAVDNALWDLKAKLLGLPLCKLLGQVRNEMPIYGSGGFCSYSDLRLQEQLAHWVGEGTPRVKIKVGRDPERDFHRLSVARRTIGDGAMLFVDANSAYDRKQAAFYIDRFASEYGVSWMEQPLTPEDRDGMRLLCELAPAPLEIADGEYCYDSADFRRFLETSSVDVLMADATRCGGITGFLDADTLCAAWRMPLSSHCAPLQHLHVACAARSYRHGEYFHDHVRIERMLFDGMPEPRDGALHPNLGLPGIGVEFKRADARHYQVH